LFHLVAATNPCPCGYLDDRRRPCVCRPATVSRYRQRVSGPLLDRFDLVVKVDRLEAVAATGPSPEASKAVRSRVTAARQVLAGGPMAVGTAAENLLIGALETALLTARGVDRVRRVAVTIAALESASGVAEDHVAEALALRADW